ncbi:histidine phosphatase superfamily [Gorgonomyces haynaldii]|nr:histidine phosphatase superfamily [Gorgonomyces haynaldii]
MDLLQVTLIHRHGARTPVPSTSTYAHQLQIAFKQCQLDLFPQSDFDLPTLMIHNTFEQSNELMERLREVKPLSCLFGQLTQPGKSMLLKLGSWMRSKYVYRGFLSDHLNQDEVHFESTNYIRTIESLQYLIAGLYPSKKRSKGPLHVWIRRDKDEIMGPNYENCPALIVETLKERGRLFEKYEHLLQQALDPLDGLVKDESSQMSRIYRWYDLLSSLEGNNMPFPKGVTKEDYARIEQAQMHIWGKIYENDQVSRLAIGPFLKEWTKHLVRKANGQQAPKLAVFSGHDTTIQPLMGAMQVNRPEYPGYASNVTLELYRENQEHYVKMLYNQKPLNVPVCQGAGKHHPSDTTLCTLDAFMERVNKLSSGDHHTICQTDEKMEMDWD